MAAVRAYDCTIVVIDTVSRAIEGEENENDTWLKFYRHTGLKMKKAGISCIRLDHSGKDGSKGQRGGSAKSGDVDAVWRMTRENDIVTLKCEAERFPVSLKEFALKRCESPLRHEITVNSYAIKRDDMFSLMTKNNIPKDPEMPVGEIQKLMRAKRIKFKNSFVNLKFYQLYCTLPQQFTPVALPEISGVK
jgi:RecA-family ATPase